MGMNSWVIETDEAPGACGTAASSTDASVMGTSALVRTGPERLVHVVPTIWVRLLRWSVRRPRERGLPRAEEEERPSSVEDHEPGHELAVWRLKRERRFGTESVGHSTGKVIELRRCLRPDELDQLEEGFADGGAQAAGQSTSLTTATRMPATAPAMPFLAASFLKRCDR
jgi:hypothetical protein